MSNTLMSNPAAQALERLRSLHWSFDFDRERSYVALMKEYLRRMGLWADALQLTDTTPFFDVAAAVLPNMRAPQALVAALNVQVHPPSPLVQVTCEWYLHWNFVCDRPEITCFQLPEPYEPLIRMYERHGSFRREHIYIDVGLTGIAMPPWRVYAKHEPLTNLDDATLDQLDATP